MQLGEALAASQRAMNVVAGLDSDVARVIVYVHRGVVLAAAGELAASQALLIEGYQIANRLNQPYFGAMASHSAGFTGLDLLDPAEACRWYTTELAQPRTANSPGARETFSFYIARARLMMGAVTEPARDVLMTGVYHATLEAAAAYVSGDLPACRAGATVGLDLARRRGNRWMEFWAVHQLARVALAEDDATAAENLLEGALELVAGQHRPWEALVNADLGVLVLVASTAAYGLQLTAIAIMPSAAAADQLTSATVTRSVSIVAVDPVTGGRAQVECEVPFDSVTGNVVLVDANDFQEVGRACDDNPTR